MHLVGGTGKGAQHPLCVLFAVGLAEHLAVHIHHRITADDHSARVLDRNGKALAPGQLFHQMGRRSGLHRTFVKVTDADGEIGGI